jgi:hypothetical protein
MSVCDFDSVLKTVGTRSVRDKFVIKEYLVILSKAILQIFKGPLLFLCPKEVIIFKFKSLIYTKQDLMFTVVCTSWGGGGGGGSRRSKYKQGFFQKNPGC